MVRKRLIEKGKRGFGKGFFVGKSGRMGKKKTGRESVERAN